MLDSVLGCGGGTWQLDQDWAREIVGTVCSYAGLVDANALCFLWPVEFNRFRFCFISGSLQQPLIAVFYPPRGCEAVLNTVKQGGAVITTTAAAAAAGGDLVDVVIRCNGSHFTLLRPNAGPQGSYGARFNVRYYTCVVTLDWSLFRLGHFRLCACVVCVDCVCECIRAYVMCFVCEDCVCECVFFCVRVLCVRCV